MFPPGSPFEQFFKDFLNRNRPARAVAAAAEATTSRRRSGGRRASARASSSIRPAIVVTNNHVIEGADEISVTLQDNTSLKATDRRPRRERRHRAAAR